MTEPTRSTFKGTNERGWVVEAVVEWAPLPDERTKVQIDSGPVVLTSDPRNVRQCLVRNGFKPLPEERDRLRRESNRHAMRLGLVEAP